MKFVQEGTLLSLVFQLTKSAISLANTAKAHEKYQADLKKMLLEAVQPDKFKRDHQMGSLEDDISLLHLLSPRIQLHAIEVHLQQKDEADDAPNEGFLIKCFVAMMTPLIGDSNENHTVKAQSFIVSIVSANDPAEAKIQVTN